MRTACEAHEGAIMSLPHPGKHARRTQECPESSRIPGICFTSESGRLDSLDVLRLPALGALSHVELHGLALLQAAEAAGLNCGEMHENIFAILTADKAIALGVVKPLHCSLFCHCWYSYSFCIGLC